MWYIAHSIPICIQIMKIWFIFHFVLSRAFTRQKYKITHKKNHISIICILVGIESEHFVKQKPSIFEVWATLIQILFEYNFVIVSHLIFFMPNLFWRDRWRLSASSPVWNYDYVLFCFVKIVIMDSTAAPSSVHFSIKKIKWLTISVIDSIS